MPFEYVLPAGLRLAEGADLALEERYEVRWRDDEDPPHYFFWAQISALRLASFVGEAFRRLPDEVQVVLEVRRSDDEMDEDPDGPAVVRWTSPVVRRAALLRTWERHADLLVHDGTLGFGAWDPDSPLEAFLDDHKLVSLFSATLDPFEDLLRRRGVPEAKALSTVLDADHEHVSIATLRDEDPSARRVWRRARSHDAAAVAASIRRSLRMRRQESPAPDDGAQD